MVEHNGYSAELAIDESDFDAIAQSLTRKLQEIGVLKTDIAEPHVHVQSALRAVVKELGTPLYDKAWKNGNIVNRYDERDLGFCGAPGRPVRKRCHRLVLTIVPQRWSPRRA